MNQGGGRVSTRESGVESWMKEEVNDFLDANRGDLSVDEWYIWILKGVGGYLLMPCARRKHFFGKSNETARRPKGTRSKNKSGVYCPTILSQKPSAICARWIVMGKKRIISWQRGGGVSDKRETKPENGGQSPTTLKEQDHFVNH